MRNKITLLEQQMEQLSIEQQIIEQKLLDQTLYDIARKNELISCLQQQMKLEKVEIAWLAMQEQLEILTKVCITNEFRVTARGDTDELR